MVRIFAVPPKLVLPVIKNVSLPTTGWPLPSAVESWISNVTVRLSVASHSKLKPNESLVLIRPPLPILAA